jgi:hypothetical protein
MAYTLLCSFNENAGWRVHKVLNVETNSISVVMQGSLKLLSIPATFKPRNGQFCNPAALVMKVVRQVKAIIRYVPKTIEIDDAPIHNPYIAMRNIRAACEAVRF